MSDISHIAIVATDAEVIMSRNNNSPMHGGLRIRLEMAQRDGGGATRPRCGAACPCLGTRQIAEIRHAGGHGADASALPQSPARLLRAAWLCRQQARRAVALHRSILSIGEIMSMANRFLRARFRSGLRQGRAKIVHSGPGQGDARCMEIGRCPGREAAGPIWHRYAPLRKKRGQDGIGRMSTQPRQSRHRACHRSRAPRP